jgi:hypothetical protein
MTDTVPSKDRLAELIADYQLRYDDRDCKCDTSDETVCKCCRGLCVCHYDFDTLAALKQLQKPAHERESPHCSTCECWKADTHSAPEPGVPLTYESFWERVRASGWNPSPEELRKLLAAQKERESGSGVPSTDLPPRDG